MDRESTCSGRTFCRYVRAIVIRLIFAAHALLVIWKLAITKDDWRYFALALSVLLLLVEAIVTLKYKKTGEWKWCCPLLFIHLLIEVPAIWLLELDCLGKARISIQQQNITGTSGGSTQNIEYITGTSGGSTQNLESTTSQIAESITEQVLRETTFTEVSTVGNTLQPAFTTQNDTAGTGSDLVSTTPPPASKNVADFVDEILNFKLSINMSDDIWVATLEQTMLFLLILGRWFLPRGELTHDQLSQLLLVFIGMASDIMELFYLFEDVVNHDFMGYVILSVWSLSLLQFSFVLTTTSHRHKRSVTHSIGKKPGLAEIESLNDTEEAERSSCPFTGTEIWAIMVSMFLQDIPFLAVRLYVVFGLRGMTFNILFFTIKNAVVISLQTYRLVVVILSREEDQDGATDSGAFVEKNPLNI